MTVATKKVSAASARAHTRKHTPSSSSSGTFKKLSLVLLVASAALTYQAIQPPPPRICGSPNGPPIASTRIKLKDGRHLAYLESGVPKEQAKHKIIFIHGFDSCRYDAMQISSQVLEEFGIYYLSFDRPGYGESDPHPKKSAKSIAFDIEELADQLGLGPKFYVVGFSMGGEIVWSCLKYIPHRLAGAALLAPVANYWWDGFPSNLSKEAYNQQLPQDKWAVGVAHYAPWLTYWWNTRKWFPGSSVIAVRFDIFSDEDKKILPKLAARGPYMAQIRQQGEFESLHRDMMVGFGSWDFSPMNLTNPFPNNEGSIHLWHGARDLIVPVSLSRYICEKLPWVHYHELPTAGHMFPAADGMADVIVKELLTKD
ncbi:uncharacterized protein LOC109725978 [Ananas comosus]|uniref:Uncharacterized protein LOC109725978 n=1 Tax=Ananas comosus TaxID=4615 RepID=A0A6P5GQQ4_ANACO|nr:uncharacterized protein LOC109725978 [Ananas comosus]